MTTPARILVTGATGFVGGHLLPALRQAFPAATLIAGLHHDPAPGWDEALPTPLDSEAALAEALAEAAPDAVVHLAAQSNVAESFRAPEATWNANLFGALRLGGAILRAAPKARLLFASTGEVYGLSFQRAEPLDEDAPLAPGNPYAAAKAAADLALGEMALRGLRVVRMRPLNHVGPGQGTAFVVSAFARQAARIAAGLQPPVMQVGALERWRDFLDVRDVCAAYALALGRFDDLPQGAIINLASGTPRKVGDILHALLARAGVSAQVEEVAAALRPNDLLRSCGNAARAREWLGWAPVIPWETTLDDVYADWRARV
ncbi:NAD-dependent epimerase/dehydratase family protein [Rhodovarius lipocyclicus]|uniref:NAD-dependent epimerase/dehydratase family protein n=1 Tax=Rhodovarius lipocyclicus TaxID=268410 RepID=UPI001359BCEB|nr:NAD-dependent epimerase/dehydratase family protein [Rhodovarius lipocyclicus]